MRQKIVTILTDMLPETQAIYLFGSTTLGNRTPESDVDIAVFSQKKLLPQQTWELSGQLALALGYDVDLIDLRNADTVMQMQVITTGSLLFTSEDWDQDHFEGRIFQLYMTLNDDRRGILNDIYSHGTVYG